jgi:hypothetical protein
MGTDGIFFIGKFVLDYNLYVGRFVECISFDWKKNSSAWGAKRSGHLQGPNLNVLLRECKRSWRPLDGCICK